MPEGTPIDREKLLSIGLMTRNPKAADRQEGRRQDGVRWQRERDGNGHDTVEHADGRVDVQINL